MINSLNLKPEDWTFIPLKDIAEIRFIVWTRSHIPEKNPFFM